MAFEQFANNAQTTLDGGIDDSTTSITVASAAGFPSQPNFRITVDGEVMLVTGASGVNWTVARAAEGTTAASHADGATVKHVLTAAALANLAEINVKAGTYASLPGAEQAGRLYLPIDGTHLLRDTGSGYQAWLAPAVGVPPSSGWTWINQGAGTMGTSYGPIVLTLPATSQVRGIYRSLPSRPFTITVCLSIQAGNFDNFQGGCGLYDSSSGKIVNLVWHRNGNFYLQKWNSYSSSSADYAGGGWLAAHSNAQFWLQWYVDDTNRICRLSNNGFSWRQVHSVSRTDFCDPDSFFLGGAPNNNSSWDMYMVLLGYAES